MKIDEKSLKNRSHTGGHTTSHTPVTTPATAPARERHEIPAFSSALDFDSAQDPAPTTMCGRGLEPIEVSEENSRDFSSKGRGRREFFSKVILQRRDREILRMCYEQQFLLPGHIRQYFYKNKNSSNARLRLLELIKAGYLRRVMNPNLDGHALIRLTPLGLRAIGDDLILEVPQVRTPDLQTLRHDATVTAVRLRLHELWTGSWLPERAIKSQDFPRVPDGLFIFPSGKKVAVEVENSLKPKTRFLRLMEDWRRIDVKLVLYVVTSDYLYSALQRYLPEGPRCAPFALVHWADLGLDQNNEVPPVWTPAGAVDVFSRKEY